jgi:hypothetical protein
MLLTWPLSSTPTSQVELPDSEAGQDLLWFWLSPDCPD